MAHSETSEHSVRRTAVVVASLCAALAVSCNVYDVSLLEQSSLSQGGSAGNVLVAGAGGASGAGVNASAGMPSTMSDAGDSAGGDSGGKGGAPGMGGSGTGGGAEYVAGGPAGGAGSLVLSVIDDMEDPDQYIPTNDLRVGYWSLSNDGSAGTQTPKPMLMAAIPGGHGDSSNALHTTATGFTKTGAQVDVDLNRKGASRLSYDASAYKAVHFWARVETGSAKAIHFAILDSHTDPGGEACCESPTTCKGSATVAKGGLCYDHFAKGLTLSNTWAEYTVPFADMNQVGWGENHVSALDAGHVFNIQFDWGIAAMDLWIDDLAFVKK